MQFLLLLLLLSILCLCRGDEFDVIVVGGGPGGLQMAHYLESAGRSYVLVEQREKVGLFYEDFPKFRHLISINKRWTGKEALEFNLRHDWNSLLSEPSHIAAWRRKSGRCTGEGDCGVEGGRVRGYDVDCASVSSSLCENMTVSSISPPSLLMREFSSDYLPKATSLVSYFQSFAKVRGLNLRTRSKVVALRRSEGKVVVKVMGQDGAVEELVAKVVVLAVGLSGRAGIPFYDPDDLSVPYDELEKGSVEAFEGKRVLVLGRGNSAMEVASAAMQVASQVHVAGSERGRIRLAWETHYPGDVRATHAQLLESYMLKSLDGVLEVPMQHLSLSKVQHHNHSQILVTDRQCDSLDRCPLRKPYDIVVSCMGWKFNHSHLFATQTPTSPEVVMEDTNANEEPSTPAFPALSPATKKYPGMLASFESVDMRGVYFGGTLMHALDFRKASGGFIHGFRYLTRALHRHLEMHHFDHVPWPHRQLNGVEDVVKAVFHRVNEASGIYQMFGNLHDLFLLNLSPTHSLQTTLYEEVPPPLIPSLILQTHPNPTTPTNSSTVSSTPPTPLPHSTSPSSHFFYYITLSLEFGRIAPKGRMPEDDYPDVFSVRRADVGPDEAQASRFLHPVLRFHTLQNSQHTSKHPTPTLLSELHIVEDFLSEWGGEQSHHSPVKRWLEDIKERVWEVEKEERGAVLSNESDEDAPLATGTTPNNNNIPSPFSPLLREYLRQEAWLDGRDVQRLSALRPLHGDEDDAVCEDAWMVENGLGLERRVHRLMDAEGGVMLYRNGKFVTHGQQGWTGVVDRNVSLQILQGSAGGMLELWSNSQTDASTAAAASFSSTFANIPVFLIHLNKPFAFQLATEDGIPTNQSTILAHVRSTPSPSLLGNETWNSQAASWSNTKHLLRDFKTTLENQF